MEKNIKNERNSIEKDIKIALDKFSDNRDIDSAILIVEKFILGNYILLGGRENIVKDSLRYILLDYKRVLKENEKLENQEATARKINELLVQRYSNSIPVQKIKDKIEEKIQEAEKDLQKAIELEKETKTKEDSILWWAAQIRLDEKIKVLKEILKEVKKRWKWR